MTNAAGARLFRIAIPVGDIDRAAAFYGAVLGGPWVRVSDGRHYFECGGVLLACVDAGAEGDLEGPRRPSDEWIYFAVADLEGALDACTRAGATPAPGDVHGDPAGKIATRPWGERSFFAHDPWGNKVCFVDEKTLFTGR